MQKVTSIDLETCCNTSMYSENIGIDTAKNELSKVSQNYGVLNGRVRGHHIFMFSYVFQ